MAEAKVYEFNAVVEDLEDDEERVSIHQPTKRDIKLMQYAKKYSLSLPESLRDIVIE